MPLTPVVWGFFSVLLLAANRRKQMWLTVDHTQHPGAGKRTLYEIEEEIFNSCIENGVLVARGSWFQTEKEKPLSGLYFRTTYAAASAEGMDKAISRFGKAVKDSFKR